MSNELFYKAAYLIQDFKTFDDWQRSGAGRSVEVPDLGTVTLVEIQGDDQWDIVTDGWGEAPQGYEGEIGLVFKVESLDGQVIYLKKRGTKSSYGYESWDGKIVQVIQTTKTFTAYTEV